MPGPRQACAPLFLLLVALDAGGIAHAQGDTDLFKQWEKQQPVTQQPAKTPATGDNSTTRQGHADATDFGDFLPAYSATTKYADLEKAMRDSRNMEKVADALNEVFALPTNIRIGLQECGHANAYYAPDNRSIIICYELLEDLYLGFSSSLKDDDEAMEAFAGAYLFIFLHEIGHALIHVWNLPITGKEEDAVDQLASFMLIQMGRPGVLAAIGGATWFGLSGNNLSGESYADEHSLSQQRYFNILCWIYGSNPDGYKDIITDELLPARRAKRCPSEYARLSQAWSKLLDPFLKR